MKLSKSDQKKADAQAKEYMNGADYDHCCARLRKHFPDLSWSAIKMLLRVGIWKLKQEGVQRKRPSKLIV